MTTTLAPDLTPGYPSKGPKLGPAWNAVWAELVRAHKRKNDTYVDGRVLAGKFAPDYGLAPATLVALLSRAALAGLIERDARVVTVDTTRGTSKKTRNHYSISPGVTPSTTAEAATMADTNA